MVGRMAWGLGCCAAAALSLAMHEARGAIVQGAGNNYVAFEAEAGRITNTLPPAIPIAAIRPWALAGGGLASGGQYLESHGPSGSGAVNGGPAVTGGQFTSTYSIIFNTAGTYNIYARVSTTNGSNDSFFVPTALNTTPTNNHSAGNPIAQFTWQQQFSINVGAGQLGTPQQFIVGVREGDAFQLDRLVLSTTGGLTTAQLNALANSHPDTSKILNPLNGKYYEMGPAGAGANGDFSAAKAIAESRFFAGGQGQLAAVETREENRFLTGLLGPFIPNDLDQGWIGLTDNATYGGSESAGTANPKIDGWVFTTPSGPISLASTGFQNWNGGEPNDFNGNEDAGQLTDVGISTNGGVWNDIPLTGTQSQSFIEYNNEPQTETASMRVVYGTGTPTIDTLAEAKALLSGALPSVREATAEIYAVNFQGPGGSGSLSPWDEGRYLGNVPFPGDGPSGDNNFAAEITGLIEIPNAGPWTFGTNSDDGVELIIDGTPVLSFDPGSTFPADTLGVFNAPDDGLYEFTLTYYENAGGAGLEFFAAEGVFSQFDPTAFRLVGDFAQGGLRFAVAVVPEPASIAVWSIMGIGLACWCWRRRRMPSARV